MAIQGLEGNRRDVVNVEADNPHIVVVGVDEPFADIGPDHPRYDPRVKLPLDEGTIGSIIQHGVLEPIGVEPAKHPKTGESIYLVVFGRRRTLMAREAQRRLKAAGKTEKVYIPVLPPLSTRNGFNAADLDEVQIIENQHRQNDTGEVLAEKIAIFVKRRGGSAQARKEAAQTFNLTMPSIESYLALNGATKEVKKAWTSGKIGQTAAAELAKQPPEEQEKNLAEAIKLAGDGKVTAELTRHVTRGGNKRGNKGGDKARPFPRSFIKRALKATDGDSKEARDAKKLLEKASAYDAFRLFAGEVGVRVIPGLAGIIQGGGVGGDAE